MHSRREFLQLAAMSVPSCAAWGAFAADKKDGSVRLGIQTYSFREMLGKPGDMTDKMIAAMRQLGITECELWEPTLQPPNLWPPSATEAYREGVRTWRLGPGLDDMKAHGEKLKAAGIRVFAFNFGLNDQCNDAEIVRGIEMTHALGAKVMTVSTTLVMAKRSVPFFEKDGLILGLHGHSNVSDPNQFATPASFEAGLAMSKQYRVNLDIGHFTAGGFEPVEFIQKHHDRITNLHIKDRKRNDGPNVPFGQGDTPITAVLQLLKRERYPIPAFIEYEYPGTGTATEEVGKCLAYVREALATTR
ncbi:MAG TPA: sugar phosphate isomerase/epimerase [Steroidobacteraceae bacterium]